MFLYSVEFAYLESFRKTVDKKYDSSGVPLRVSFVVTIEGVGSI